jgi:hypothetical protein
MIRSLRQACGIFRKDLSSCRRRQHERLEDICGISGGAAGGAIADGVGIRTAEWRYWCTLLIVGGAGIAYVFSFLLGVPAYLFLRARRLTDFWIAPAAGAIAAVVVWYAFAAFLAISLSGLSRLSSRLADPEVARIAIFFMLSGAVVGTIFWLIARPDRQSE